MLRITVEILPHGNTQKKRTIASMEIWNDGTGTIETGNYEGAIRTDDSPEERRGQVTDYPRLTQNVWSLVGAFLQLFGHTGHPTHREL